MKIAITQWFNRYLSDPQAAYLLLFIVLGVLVVSTLGDMLAPLLTSIVIAYLLDWPVTWLQKLRCPHSLAVLIIFILFIAIIVLTLLGILPLLSKQVSNLVVDLPHIITRLQAMVATIPQWLPFVKPAQIDTALTHLDAQISQSGQMLLSQTLAILPSIMSAVVYLVMVPLLVYFFLHDKKQICGWLGKRFVPQQRQALLAVWGEVHIQIGNYIRGKVVEAIIVTIVTYIVFIILGLKYSLLLAALIGLSVFIPYIGAIVVTLPVVIVGVMQWGWSSHFLYLMLAYAAIIILDGNVLAPLLFAEAVSLHPIAIIIAVLIFGGIWGFWGIFFAIPLAALVNAIIRFWPRVKVVGK